MEALMFEVAGCTRLYLVGMEEGLHLFETN